jgi:tetratricopeptide (TPR) repeat protein
MQITFFQTNHKNQVMKTIQTLYISILLSFSIACQNAERSQPNSSEIPELLLRDNVIGPEEEMGYMMDQYNTLAEKIKANGSDHDARLSLAELFMMEARISGEHGYYYPAALKVLGYVLENDSKDHVKYRALLDKASVLLSLHQFEEAKKIAEMALTLNPHSADIYGVLVDAHVELGEYKEAITCADKMVSIRPDLRSYSRISYLREIHGFVDEAVDAMKMAVAAGYPGMEQTEWARLTLGHLYERYGALDSAMMQYGMALSSRPNYPFAIAAQAKLYAAQGQTQKADSLNASAMHLIPEVGFYVDRATWELERGNQKKAKELTEEILAMIADDEKAGHKMSLEMARIQMSLLGNSDKALEYAMEEYSIRPNNIEVNKLLAEIYYTKNNLVNAQKHLDVALHTGSKDPELKCLEGLLLAKSDQLEQGSGLIKSVFVENPYLDCSFCKEARQMIL